jgi:hypothetical protein
MSVTNQPRSLFKYGTLFTTMLLFSSIVVAQTPTQPKQFKFKPGIDASVGLMGETTFSRNDVGNFVLLPTPGYSQYFLKSQSSSTSGGGLFTFHDAIKPYLGFNVNFSYSQFKHSFAWSGGTISWNPPIVTGYGDVGSLNTRMYELTASYAFEGPHVKRFRTFGQFAEENFSFSPSLRTSLKKRCGPRWSLAPVLNTGSARVSPFPQNIVAFYTRGRIIKPTVREAILSRGYSPSRISPPSALSIT